MEIIIILFIAVLVYNYLFIRQRDEAEKNRFREFVSASKTKNVNEYVESIPSDINIDIKDEDELVDLDQLTPEELLSIRQKEVK